MRKSRNTLPMNLIINIVNKFLRDPIHITLKYLYPKFYRIDNILTDQMSIYKKEEDCTIVNLK